MMTQEDLQAKWGASCLAVIVLGISYAVVNWSILGWMAVIGVVHCWWGVMRDRYGA